jgi:hypothetical protein
LWLPFLTGALVPYTQPDVWLGSPDDQFDAAQEVEKLLNALAGAAVPEEGVIVSELDLTPVLAFPALVRTVVALETADEVLLTLDAVFDAGSLTIGDDSDPARLMPAVDLTALNPGDQIQLSPQYRYPAGTEVKVYLTGSPTTGAARITLYSFLHEA